MTGRSSGEENYHFYLFINLFSCHARSSVFFPLPSRYVSSLILPKQYRTLTNLLQFRLRFEKFKHNTLMVYILQFINSSFYIIRLINY